MFTSIRMRLVFSYLAVIILAMGLSGLLLLSFVQRYFMQAAEDSLIAQARITAQALIPQVRVGGPEVDAATAPYNAVQQQQLSNLYVQAENVGVPPAPQTDLSYLSNASLQLGSQLTTRIRILDTAGTVLLDSWQQQTGTSLIDESLVARAMQGDYASRTTEHSMGVALPMEVDGQTVGYVVVSQPLDDVSAVLVDLRKRWILSTGIGALLAGAAALLLSLAITRPVRRLTAAAEAVAQGQFDQPIPVQSRDELGKLSRTFNEMVARLQSARQMQTNFVANVSHELRTPLTSIKGTVETLRAGAVDDIEVRDSFLKTVEAETDRLIRLVNDLLILSRVDSAALNLRLERVNILELAQNMARRFAPLAAAKHLRVQIEPGQGTSGGVG